MPAEIMWTRRRAGALRFGPRFVSSSTRDPYTGCGVIEDAGEGLCIIGPLAGALTPQDRDDILKSCAESGFTRARVERNGKQWEYDLTKHPYKRKAMPHGISDYAAR